eukprot:COSAG06_NODE_1119_length_10634_cov_3.222117_19_plen_68_part_00
MSTIPSSGSAGGGNSSRGAGSGDGEGAAPLRRSLFVRAIAPRRPASGGQPVVAGGGAAARGECSTAC